MTKVDDRKAALVASGYDERHSTKKVTLFQSRSSKIFVYLKNLVDEIHLVLPPHAQSSAQELLDNAGLPPLERFHNSNLREFPARKHTGRDETRFGYTASFRTIDELKNFARDLDAITLKRPGSGATS
jgi:hypothetical protein